MGELIHRNFAALFKAKDIPLAAPVLVIYAAVGIFLVPQFVSSANITSILFSVAALLPAVLGTQLLLVLGRFDLSIGANAGLSGMLAAICLNRYGSNIFALFIGLLAGILVGLIVGLLVARLGD